MSFVPRYEEEVALKSTAENELLPLKKVSSPKILTHQIRTEDRGIRSSPVERLSSSPESHSPALPLFLSPDAPKLPRGP